jgi:hypothetical protein
MHRSDDLSYDENWHSPFYELAINVWPQTMLDERRRSPHCGVRPASKVVWPVTTPDNIVLSACLSGRSRTAATLPA